MQAFAARCVYPVLRTTSLLFVLGLACLTQAAEAKKPNLLLVIADDATFNEMSLFGGTNLKTPNVDRLASQGLLFRRAYVGMSMCTPCRSELYTGLYPVHSAVCWNHGAAKPGTRSIVQHLGDAGYRVGIAGKVDVRPKSVFPFEMVDGFERNCVARTADYNCAGIKEFMTRNRSQPFCLVIGLVVPHSPWTVGHPEHFDPKKLKLAPYMVDTPETRRAYARYLAEYEVMDQQLGDILKTLDETGEAGQTLVFFTSEQGGQWPGCKWTAWEEGLHTALLARWPGHVRPGTSTDALVQYADVLPTLVEVAGGTPAKAGFDGTSFLSVLLGKAKEHRQYAYAMHNNLPEGAPYPIRSVSDGRFRYLRNLQPEALYFNRWIMASPDGPYWPSWVGSTVFDLHGRAMVTRYMRRPAEELYDLEADPAEMHNLAADPTCATTKAGLASALDAWMQAQSDPGAILDTEQKVGENQLYTSERWPRDLTPKH
jgi:N-sulfoglucosamine sulfohydrolase